MSAGDYPDSPPSSSFEAFQAALADDDEVGPCTLTKLSEFSRIKGTEFTGNIKSFYSAPHASYTLLLDRLIKTHLTLCWYPVLKDSPLFMTYILENTEPLLMYYVYRLEN